MSQTDFKNTLNYQNILKQLKFTKTYAYIKRVLLICQWVNSKNLKNILSYKIGYTKTTFC